MRLRSIAGTRNLVGPTGVSLDPSVEVGLGGQVVRLLEIAALMRGDKVVRELHRVSAPRDKVVHVERIGPKALPAVKAVAVLHVQQVGFPEWLG